MYSSKYPNRYDLPSALSRAAGGKDVCEAFSLLPAGERERFCSDIALSSRRFTFFYTERENGVNAHFDDAWLC